MIGQVRSELAPPFFEIRQLAPDRKKLPPRKLPGTWPLYVFYHQC